MDNMKNRYSGKNRYAARFFKRIAAGFLCAVMMLTGLPSEFLGGIGLIDEVAAEEKEITILDGTEEKTVKCYPGRRIQLVLYRGGG